MDLGLIFKDQIVQAFIAEFMGVIYLIVGEQMMIMPRLIQRSKRIKESGAAERKNVVCPRITHLYILVSGGVCSKCEEEEDGEPVYQGIQEVKKDQDEETRKLKVTLNFMFYKIKFSPI